MSFSVKECEEGLKKCGFSTAKFIPEHSDKNIYKFAANADDSLMSECLRKDKKLNMQFLIEILLEFGYSRESLIGDSHIKLNIYVLRRVNKPHFPTTMLFSQPTNSISETVRVQADELQQRELRSVLSECPNLMSYFGWKTEDFLRNDPKRENQLWLFMQANPNSYFNNLVPPICKFSQENLDIFVELRGNPSLRDMFAFCPLQFRKSEGILIVYLIYQVLALNSLLQQNGLHLPPLSCSDIFISESYWLTFPPFYANNEQTAEGRMEGETTEGHSRQTGENRDFYSSVREWQSGRMSNFDYLMLLNSLAGRRMDSARNHPILPWVMDFEHEEGNLRDLTKSKYRLNKGDDQLDVTFSGFFETVHENELAVNKHKPHHIAGMLSDVTYYMYLARRTPKSLLRSIVRQRWVPKEYPASLSRLYSWTPDECIPQFFTDSTIFESIHEDLDDLQLPSWAKSAEHFIECHRRVLESEEVSRDLHHWIDITFGYKLTGEAALEAKNVTLAFVSDSMDLYSHNTVKIFDREHPPRFVSKSPLDSFDSFDPTEMLRHIETTGHFFGSAAPTVFGDHRQVVPEEVTPTDDWMTLTCLIAEITFFDGLSFVGLQGDLATRHRIARHYYGDNKDRVPMAMRELLEVLFDRPNSSLVPHMCFPRHLDQIYSFAAECEKLEWRLCSQLIRADNLNFTSLLNSNHQLISDMAIQVHSFCLDVLPTLNQQEISCVLPTVKSLLNNRFLALKVMPFCFDDLTKHLSQRQINVDILPLLRRLYTIDDPDPTFLKLYCPQFLAIVRRRLGDDTFLSLFTEIFVHTLAGFPPEETMETDLSVDFPPGKIPGLRLNKTQLSEICENNIYWLFNEIGPVLSAVYVTRKLLGVMELSYFYPEYRKQCAADSSDYSSFCLIEGDFYSRPVVRCLLEAASLFGEEFITDQYFEYVKAMIAIISASLQLNGKKEAVLIGSLVLLRCCVSSLSDHLLAKLVDETIIPRMLSPVIKMVSSPQNTFSSGGAVRLVIAYKIVDVVSVLGQRFQLYKSWDKLPDVVVDILSPFDRRDAAQDQLSFVYCQDFAVDCYSMLCKTFGRRFLRNNVWDYKVLCKFMKIVMHFVSTEKGDDPAVLARLSANSKLIEKFKTVNRAKPMNSQWLAYWTYQIGLGRNENVFDLKQIKLESFLGHSSSVPKLQALTTENRFLSVSRDKSVRMWSILDLNKTGSLWTYSMHKKPVWGLALFENTGHSVSCDASLHTVDYSIGKAVRIFEPKFDIAEICPLHAPSSTLLLATTRFNISLYDIRTKTPSYFFRLLDRIGSGSVNSVSIDPSDTWVALSTSTGLIYVTDIRSGRIMTTYHSPVEIKKLNACYKSLLVAAGADRSLMGLKMEDDLKHDFGLFGHQEVVSQFEVHNNDLVTLSSQHKLGWYGNFASKRCVYQSMEVPANLFKGNIRSFTFLPRSQLILVASDYGEISLLR